MRTANRLDEAIAVVEKRINRAPADRRDEPELLRVADILTTLRWARGARNTSWPSPEMAVDRLVNRFEATKAEGK